MKMRAVKIALKQLSNKDIRCSSLWPREIDIRSPHNLSAPTRLCRKAVKGRNTKEQTSRQRPLTDLTPVICPVPMSTKYQIKMNELYSRDWRTGSLSPISSAPVTVHIERLIERLR